MFFQAQFTGDSSESDAFLVKQLSDRKYRLGRITGGGPTVATATITPSGPTGAPDNIIINGVTVTIADPEDVSTTVNEINAASIPNITASLDSTFLRLTNAAGGDITISSSGAGDALTYYGFDAFYPASVETVVTEDCLLVDQNDIDEGKCYIIVQGFGLVDDESVRKLTANVLFTFEGNKYSWRDAAADEVGETDLPLA